MSRVAVVTGGSAGVGRWGATHRRQVTAGLVAAATVGTARLLTHHQGSE